MEFYERFWCLIFSIKRDNKGEYKAETKRTWEKTKMSSVSDKPVHWDFKCAMYWSSGI